MRRRLSPPPRLTVSDWADHYRVLSREASAEPGRWQTSRAPYLRGIMDAFSEQLVNEVVVMSSSQIGKTETVNNVVGYYIDQDPAPILVVQPNVDPMAKAWSKERFAPMVRDSPRLKEKVREPRSRDSGNTILHKIFAGGHLTVIGANSPAGLSSRPIRIALFDEVDRYPDSAGSEGDPVTLGVKRTQTFHKRKIGMFSTPGIKGISRIEAAYEESDRRRYHVPCPHCGKMQALRWAGLVWESDESSGEPIYFPETTRYQCAKCKKLIDELDKSAMLEAGEWIAELPGVRIAGFHLNALYSPWVRWAELVDDFLKSKDDPTRLQVFVNTVLGETWEESAEKIDATSLSARREAYDAEVPAPVGVLTAGVDIQVDRLELAIKGWAEDEESYLIAHHRLHGDPEGGEVWQRLETLLSKPYGHASGGELRIRSTMIDSGYRTDVVYGFVRTRQSRNIFASKGVEAVGRTPLTRAKKPNREGVKLWTIGTIAMKDIVFARLHVSRPGPGYMHFCEHRADVDGVDAEYFAQFESEKVVRRFERGRVRRKYIQVRSRNEALDLEVLNLAALHALGPAVRKNLGELARQVPPAGAVPPGPVRRRRVRSRGIQ